MAEGESNANVVDLTKEIDVGDKAVEGLECAVCLQTCIHPAQLPCGHIFCFLCIKGIANQSKKCAMCRQEIPRDFIEHPNLLHHPNTSEETENYDGNYQWFYEGRNGWWRYDERTSEDLEEAFSMNLRCFEILICGELYVIDFEEKVQYPKYNSSRKRFIKRDKPENVAVKGIAGWWQYDERTSKELEACYKAGERTCELLIAGFLYITDLEVMLQLRRNDPSRRRRIKRDLATIPKKGIAGLRTECESHPHQELLHADSPHRPHSPIEGQMDNLTPITPSNTPQSPTSGRESPQQNNLQATMDRIQSLHLEDGHSDRSEGTGREESHGHSDGSPYLQVGQRNVFQFRHRNVD